MTKAEMLTGFEKGRALIQEEWAHPHEIQWVDELISEGKATATPWEYKDGFQCERRRITGITAVTTPPAAETGAE
jgi:hypothetical protein